jgi:hypothetical protein
MAETDAAECIAAFRITPPIISSRICEGSFVDTLSRRKPEFDSPRERQIATTKDKTANYRRTASGSYPPYASLAFR